MAFFLHSNSSWATFEEVDRIDVAMRVIWHIIISESSHLVWDLIVHVEHCFHLEVFEIERQERSNHINHAVTDRSLDHCGVCEQCLNQAKLKQWATKRQTHIKNEIVSTFWLVCRLEQDKKIECCSSIARCESILLKSILTLEDSISVKRLHEMNCLNVDLRLKLVKASDWVNVCELSGEVLVKAVEYAFLDEQRIQVKRHELLVFVIKSDVHARTITTDSTTTLSDYALWDLDCAYSLLLSNDIVDGLNSNSCINHSV